jgi:hypothetical protein
MGVPDRARHRRILADIPGGASRFQQPAEVRMIATGCPFGLAPIADGP